MRITRKETRTEATAAYVQYAVKFRMCPSFTTLIIILYIIFLIFDNLTFWNFYFW